MGNASRGVINTGIGCHEGPLGPSHVLALPRQLPQQLELRVLENQKINNGRKPRCEVAT